MYETLEDAKFRLDGTIVYYQDRFILVKSCKPLGGKICLESSTGNVIKLSDPLLKIRSIPTGYISVEGVVLFLSRCPTRRYRQGLRSDNTFVYNASGKEVSFLRLVELVSAGGKVGLITDDSEIISKDFLITGNALLYRRRYVGYVSGGKVRLNNDTQFLKEAVSEYLEVL